MMPPTMGIKLTNNNHPLFPMSCRRRTPNGKTREQNDQSINRVYPAVIHADFNAVHSPREIQTQQIVQNYRGNAE